MNERNQIIDRARLVAKHRILQVMHIPYKREGVLFKNEGKLVYNPDTADFVMESCGNETPYKHKMYVNASQPYITVRVNNNYELVDNNFELIEEH